MSKGAGYRQFSEEFKLDAVKLVVNNDRSINSVSKELGISYGALSRWVKEYRESPTDTFQGKVRLTHRDDEIMRLKRENANLREEREILKKAVSIFSVRRK